MPIYNLITQICLQSLSFRKEIIKIFLFERNCTFYHKYDHTLADPVGLQLFNPFLPTVPTFAVRETDVSRHNGGS